MRLINVRTQELETRKLEDFTSGERQYAILSHTWGTEEITFDEMKTKPDKQKAGWRKIDLSCRQAKEDGYDYVWCDTCCIDKNSSAELSESINSMFLWYQEAGKCYAFLEDIQEVEELPKARWFTRGWTLQELVAPKSLVFYVSCNTAWREIGTREEATMAKKIAGITGIDESFLRGVDSMSHLHGASFAKRVAWAADRKTERSEDIAYCLMGLLDVNMPLLYGEGGVKAFRRLQEEYLKVHPDQSFLAWLLPPGKGEPRTSDGDLLASLPKDFRGCNGISLASDDAVPFTLNNKGLQIRLPLFQNRSVDAIRSPEYFAVLACYSDAQPEYRIRISLRAVERSAGTLAFLPSDKHHPVLTDEFDAASLTNCFILRTPPPLTPRLLSVNGLPELISWKPKIIYLNASTGTWDCLSKPGDLDPSILRPELSSQFPPIRVPDQREWASYGVLLHPPSPCSDNTSSDCENPPCLKVLIRVDVRFERRYELNVRIQLFHIARNEILTDWEDRLSVLSTEPPLNSRSRTISIPTLVPTQLSETIHASASWKRISSQDELSVKIHLASVDRHRAHALYALSITAFSLLVTKDPWVHATYGIIAMLVLITLGQPNAFPFESLGLGLAVTSVYFIALQKVHFMGYIRPEYRLVYWRSPFVLAFLLLSNKNFVEYNDRPSARYYATLHWSLAILSAYYILQTFVGRMGYKFQHEKHVYAQESDPSTGLESLLLDDTIR